jgi:cytochrome c
MGGGPVTSLKTLALEDRVKAITYCDDTYRITTSDGKTREFQERNLHFNDGLGSG